jgi:hypothetical protein
VGAGRALAGRQVALIWYNCQQLESPKGFQMSAIATKNSNAPLPAGIGPIIVIGLSTILIGNGVLDGMRGEHDCRPRIEWCPMQPVVAPDVHDHEPEPSAPTQGRPIITVTSSATSTLFPPRR